jgi:hypothetical protein
MPTPNNHAMVATTTAKVTALSLFYGDIHFTF